MKINVKPYNNKELLLFPPSIGDYLPKNDLAHVIDEVVEMIDLEPYYNKIPKVGNSSYHPALMIKIWFYGYATKVYSSRKIEEKLYKDIAFIYLAGMQKPAPDLIRGSEFRRKNLEELKNSFVDILQICHRLGLTSLGEISLDSKVMKANASASRTYDEKRLIKEREVIQKAIDEYLEKVNQTDIEEDQKYGPNNRGNELPEDISERENRIKKMKQIVEQLKQAQERLKQSGKEKINLTDKDAQFQKSRTTKILPGYRCQIAVDSKSQIIVANDVTNEQNDVSQLIPMVDKVLENVNKIAPEKFSEENQNKESIKVTADGGYNSSKNLVALESEKYKDKIEAYIPCTNSLVKERGESRDVNSPFHRSKFIYDNAEDSFICPVGKKLYRTGQKIHHGVGYSLYSNYNACKSCAYYRNRKCTTNKRGRVIWLPEHHHIVDRMRQKLSTPAGKQIYEKRKTTVEAVLGNLSQNLGFREFLVRGEPKVKGEFSLMCTAHNILKIARFVKKIGQSLKKLLSQPKFVLVIDTS